MMDRAIEHFLQIIRSILALFSGFAFQVPCQGLLKLHDAASSLSEHDCTSSIHSMLSSFHGKRRVRCSIWINHGSDARSLPGVDSDEERCLRGRDSWDDNFLLYAWEHIMLCVLSLQSCTVGGLHDPNYMLITI